MIADTIKELRQARNWTQSELARKLGITRNGVNAWEQGISTPSLTSVIELPKVFSVPVDFLVGLSSLDYINVAGLDNRDISLVIELIDRLREKSK